MQTSTSVTTDKDSVIISSLMEIHGVSDPLVLDCTHNKGVMWKGISEPPRLIRSDIAPSSAGLVDLAADFMHIPFADSSIDIIVFDPPHLPTAAASQGSSLIWETRYGITDTGKGREGDNVCGMFVPFLEEAKRVLNEDGIVLAKLCDIVHSHRYQWQMVCFVNAASKVGMTSCDMVIKVRKSGPISSKWVNVKHVRRRHSYWIVVRNSNRCERR